VAGASTDPCSRFYQGPSPSSELETKAVQAEAVRLGSTLLTSIHLHVYGQKWLIPWGATHPDGSCVYATDYRDMVGGRSERWTLSSICLSVCLSRRPTTTQKTCRSHLFRFSASPLVCYCGWLYIIFL